MEDIRSLEHEVRCLQSASDALQKVIFAKRASEILRLMKHVQLLQAEAINDLIGKRLLEARKGELPYKYQWSWWLYPVHTGHVAPLEVMSSHRWHTYLIDTLTDACNRFGHWNNNDYFDVLLVKRKDNTCRYMPFNILHSRLPDTHIGQIPTTTTVPMQVYQASDNMLDAINKVYNYMGKIRECSGLNDRPFLILETCIPD